MRKSPSQAVFRWLFEPTLDMAKEIGAVIDRNIAAARFWLSLIVEPGNGPVCLEVTGPDGTSNFLKTLLEAMPGTGIDNLLRDRLRGRFEMRGSLL